MTFQQLVSKYRKVHIITHTDLDGYGAGAILYHTMLELGFDSDNIKITHTDYTGLPFLDGYDLTFIADISVSNESTATAAVKYATTPGKKLIWFDHHQTSIDLCENNPKLRSILGKRDTHACGTMICWFFYQLVVYNKDTNISSMTSIEKVFELMSKIEPEALLKLEGRQKGLVFDYIGGERFVKTPIMQTPIMILLTDDYDRFVLDYPESSWLMEAFNELPIIEKDCKSKFWEDSYMKIVELSDRYLNNILVTGRQILLWRKIFFLNNLLKYGFVSSFLKEGMSDINMICINTTEKGSLNFGSLLKKGTDNFYYDYGCVYSHNGEKYTASIYCSDPIERKDVPNGARIGQVYNAADICRRFGGGGHIGAAGFVIDEIPFYHKQPIPESVKAQIREEINDLYGELFN